MSLSLALQKSRDIPILARRKRLIETWEHLTKAEYAQYRPVTNWSNIELLLPSPVSELSDSTRFSNLIPVQRDYVLLLAFLQRGSLPIELAFPTKIVFSKFPFSELPNFHYFDELYDRYYSSFYPMDSEKQIMKAKNKIQLLRTVVCLWFAGYALNDGLGGNKVITSSVLEKSSKTAKSHRSSLTILGKMLVKEADSKIEAKPLLKFNEAEKNLWASAGIFPAQTSFEESLHNFAFTYLVGRVNGAITEDHFNAEGILLFRYGKKTISQNYWKSVVKYVRYFAICAKSLGINNLNEVSISNVYNDLISQLKGQVDKSLFRVALRLWLKWLIRTTSVNYNIERIMPSPKRVLSKNHGRVFSMSKSYILVQSLLNDQNSLINENDIMDYRYRRGCLLILATAARPQEILNLLQEAKFKDSHGEYWIRFHKTKTIRNQSGGKSFEWVHQVSVKSDAVRWFDELLHFAPSEPLHFPIESGGDDLTELRIFATKHNDGPIQKGFYNFLGRIQRKLFPDLTKPYFTPHNLRALHLTYRRIMGDNDLLMERQAGHSHPSSKKPYTQTMSSEEVGKFADIFKKGVWGDTQHETSVDDQSFLADKDVNLDEITKVSSKFMVTQTKLEEILKLTQKVMEAAPLKFQGKVIETERELTGVAVGGYTHNCNAHVLLNCGHTPGHCRACDYYSPDEGTEDAHRVEVFREMLHYYFCIDAEKEFKSTGHRKMVFQKAEDIKERLGLTESKLWVDKFGMKPIEAKKLHALLWKKAKRYFREESKINPKPSTDQILQYMNSGEMT
ncbi:site-specific integrase [Paenibacillus frigoriresistens]|uniref:site-specific integrase n=1 Tax=Paenibacillus alginolyticus TaxID=59839 RepID=UPI001567277C|nr:site-specific integrase [Paenibacillus frigoriresistens]NRF94844.1 site-specific integrase [Paenibacillus frigoriresistens]